MCRALTVLCVAEDVASLRALKAAAVSAEWEVAPGAIDEAAALTQLDLERPHVLVAFGPYERLVGLAAARLPGMRIVADRNAPGVDAVAASLADVRSLVRGDGAAPGGPVRSP
jgi:hypothetical protein